MDTRKSKAFAECEVEKIVLVWFESQSLGWAIKYGPDIAPGTLEAERDDFGQVVLAPPGSPFSRTRCKKNSAKGRKSLSGKAHE